MQHFGFCSPDITSGISQTGQNQISNFFWMSNFFQTHNLIKIKFCFLNIACSKICNLQSAKSSSFIVVCFFMLKYYYNLWKCLLVPQEEFPYTVVYNNALSQHLGLQCNTMDHQGQSLGSWNIHIISITNKHMIKKKLLSQKYSRCNLTYTI